MNPTQPTQPAAMTELAPTPAPAAPAVPTPAPAAPAVPTPAPAAPAVPTPAPAVPAVPTPAPAAPAVPTPAPASTQQTVTVTGGVNAFKSSKGFNKGKWLISIGDLVARRNFSIPKTAFERGEKCLVTKNRWVVTFSVGAGGRVYLAGAKDTGEPNLSASDDLDDLDDLDSVGAPATEAEDTPQ